MARDVILVGKKYGGEAALEEGIVDMTADAESTLSKAVELARQLAPKGINKDVLGVLKKELFAGMGSSATQC